MNVLVTGGAGYIGSHTVIELIKAGHHVTIVDNFSNSSRVVLDRLEKITGQAVECVELDVADRKALAKVFSDHSFDAAIHFAGLKAVGESVSQPLRYYRNNIDSTLSLCEVMAEHGVKKLVFSSSATVYGKPERNPIRETAPLSATNPYGQTKLMIEQMLRDLVVSDKEWQISLLRYFNPVGAHESGLIGEDPNGIPNNLMPFISQVAVGKLKEVSVFGNDYETHDGTGVRDYIHVVDLAKAHVQALEHMPEPGAADPYNIATGTGYSVLDMIKAFEKASGKDIPFRIVDRRPGDIASCYADPAKAKRELHWQAEKTLEDMCADAWRWQSVNPDGFAG
jgi:UDP-glucose 4-epimerase